jgi:hypothetical protein
MGEPERPLLWLGPCIALFAAVSALEQQVTVSLQTKIGREAVSLAIMGILMGLSSVLTPSSSSKNKWVAIMSRLRQQLCSSPQAFL